ncbi:MAG: hypothetical protein IPL10_06520 [Bacteroidetes bacterium]|nr:hypothetical protein [Bacteroidota bacterium]
MQIISLIDKNEFGATVLVRVKNVLTFQDILKTRPPKELPKYWADFTFGHIGNREFSVSKFGKYYYTSINIQSDLGQNLVFTEYENQFYVCRVNEWSLCQNYNYGGKYILPNFLKDKIFSEEIYCH